MVIKTTVVEGDNTGSMCWYWFSMVGVACFAQLAKARIALMVLVGKASMVGVIAWVGVLRTPTWGHPLGGPYAA